MMNAFALRIVQEWQDNTVIDIDHMMIRMTMSIIGKILFDTDFPGETDELGAAINTGLAYAVRTISSPLTLPLSVPTPSNRRVRQAQHLIEARLSQMIDERRQVTPESFQPERFTPEREKSLPPLVYIPSGAGPRICIGNHLALMEGQLFIATLAQRCTFSLVPGQEIVPDVVHHLTLRPGNPVQVQVKVR